MNKMRKILVLVLVAAIVSLGLTACKKSEHPYGEPPTEETVPEKTPSGDHPAGEHPAGEHPG